ncbi:MAG TPA: N-acetylmuramoyl-L-alanine amidase, partial [Vicinamibacterales bacterium]|nr:N-acetylmuramoyl-L-alanine amidase [Vicinamibacterales bacterium]
GPVLQGVRIGEPKSTIVLDLGPRFGSYRAAATTRDATSEVVIHLSPASAAPPPAAAPSTPPLPPPLPTVAPATVAHVRTVVIDAGHGGDEAGAPGPGGTAEKEITLAIARRLRAALEGRLGMRVLMTRDGDQAVSLDERAALANTNKANLFVSIHANASQRPATRGAQVYYSSAGQTGEEARRAALAGQWLPTVGGSREVELILWEMAQVRHLGESAAFATLVEEELRTRLAVNERPVLQAPFRVLAAANMPAVLVEVGFLSNPEEAAQLTTAKHQDAIVQALLQSIVRFRDLVERGGVSGVPDGAPRQGEETRR